MVSLSLLGSYRIHHLASLGIYVRYGSSERIMVDSTEISSHLLGREIQCRPLQNQPHIHTVGKQLESSLFLILQPIHTKATTKPLRLRTLRRSHSLSMDERDNADDRELEAQGYTQAMPRRFSLLSLLSLSFALTATWNGFGSAIGTSLGEFSSSGTFWTLVIAATMNLLVSLGMAELSSAYPKSGAQYCWSFRVAKA